MEYEISKYKKNICNNIDIYIEDSIISKWINSLDVSDSTKETYYLHVIDFLNWAKKYNLKYINKEDILAYKKYLIDTYSNSTVCLKISSIKSLYRFLEEESILKDVVKNIKGAKISKGFKRDIFTIKQIKRIMISIDKRNILGIRDYALINLLFRTGLRSCEIYRANIEDIRIKDGQTVLYVQGKGRTDKDEFVVLTATMSQILNEYLNLREQKQHVTDNAPLFISVSDRNFGNRLSLFSIRWVVKNILRNAGIDNKRLTTHSTRHTAITLSLLNGADILDVKEMARHQNINTTLLYSHNVQRIENAPEKKLEEVFEKII